MRTRALTVCITVLALAAAPCQAVDIFKAAPSAAPPPSTVPASVQKLADQLSISNVETTTVFSAGNSGIRCFTPGPKDHWSLRCHAIFEDTARDDQAAGLDFVIYAQDVDFKTEDTAMIAEATAKMPGRWHIDEQPDVSINTPNGGKLKYKLDCRQARGNPNQIAICMLKATSRVLVVSEVLPAETTSESIDNSDTGTFADIRHAVDLATHGAVHVLKSLH